MLQVTYLKHSGFAVDTGQKLLFFDVYQDPAGQVPKLMAQEREVYFFCSHVHGDHFNPNIGQWQKQVRQYVLSDDILPGQLTGVSANRITFLPPYAQWESADLQVQTFGSTDAGVSFALQVEGKSLFYAGDFNWWHWKEDTPANIAEAEELFRKEMAIIAGKGLSFDLVFFPVDSRLEEFCALGAVHFCRQVPSRQLIAMHTWDVFWQPPDHFPGQVAPVPVWCPQKPGEKRDF